MIIFLVEKVNVNCNTYKNGWIYLLVIITIICYLNFTEPSGQNEFPAAKGLEKNESQGNPIEYPCSTVNRCPYDCVKGEISNTKFKVEDLFELANMAFAVEIALVIMRKETSGLRIKTKKIFIKY